MADLYKEDLPDQCPPAESQEIRANMHVFRLIETAQPKDNDFLSQRASNPDAVFGVDECIARGVSVWVQQADVARLKKIPKFRNAKVCRVNYTMGPGRSYKPLIQTIEHGGRLRRFRSSPNARCWDD